MTIEGRIENPATPNAIGAAPSASVAALPDRRHWLLGLLTAAMALNMLDRKIINILAEPIKHDLGLSDAQLGALTGLAFALLYCTAALPIARFADRGDRVRIVGIAALVWSAFTALGGAATNFMQLFLFRIGVGVGEAGCAPPSQSLIVDHFPPEKRSSALAIFNAGSSIGAAVGLIAGGFLAGWIGWRWTIVSAGIPGIIIGLLVLFTLRDPRRSRPASAAPKHPPLKEVLGALLRNRSFMLISLAFGFVGLVGVSTMAFAGSFYLRNHAAGLEQLSSQLGMTPLAVIGLGLGLFGALGGAAGTVSGGFLGDWLGKRHVNALVYIPAAGALLSTFGYVAMFTVSDVALSLALSAVAVFFLNFFAGPGSLAIQRIAGDQRRATALSITMFIGSGIGVAIGPLLVGKLSDMFAVDLGIAEGLRAAILVGISAAPIAAILFAAASFFLVRDMAKEA